MKMTINSFRTIRTDKEIFNKSESIREEIENMILRFARDHAYSKYSPSDACFPGELDLIDAYEEAVSREVTRILKANLFT